MTTTSTHWLIIGAGPYGLAAAAWAKARGIDHVVVGSPMQFWRDHMPRGMILRSGADWHLDPFEEHTLAAYAAARGLDSAALEPITLERFLDYAVWFTQGKGISVRQARVTRLDRRRGRFLAQLAGGEAITARHVLIAAGFRYFTHEPSEYVEMFPARQRTHTCHLGPLDRFGGQRVAIIGGRQSAFETAALLHEAGAKLVNVIHRHDTPRFEVSDWSWVAAMVKRTLDEPDWYVSMSQAERDALANRFWSEGRLKLEPWLGPRVHGEGIHLHPHRRVVSADAQLNLTLDDGQMLAADHIVLATGYRVDIASLPYLAAGGLLADLTVEEGFPALDRTMQSSAAGLYFTSLAATRRFGPFFGFVVGAATAAEVVGRAVQS